ncbi:MAG TPA: serine hydroxymethyltransferase [Desulfobacteraceae bacterium]|nr:serine hydroxymethyltransferase [Desulfobacteraceae bacterium]
MISESLKEIDPEIYRIILGEVEREQNTLIMIASENYATRAVIEAQANIMTNKYAEGYPSMRYYGGCDYVDMAESLAIERAKRLFGAEHANVQPHSGSQANMAVYIAMLSPGDKILGMELSHGGHLTHGSQVNFSGKLYKSISYGVDRVSHLIDYDHVYDLAKRHRPRLIIAGASAYPRKIDFEKFSQIAQDVNAYLMVDMAHIAGLVAAGLHPSPVGRAQLITSTTHKTLRGPRGGFVLCDREYAQSIDKALFPGIQGGPLMHVIAAKAVCFSEALSEEFRRYQIQVIKNAKVLSEELRGYGFELVSGGTDNHLVLVDLRSKGITGLEAERVLASVGIITNKNTIPFDDKGPKITSGLRLGTPALTTRGMKEEEMKIIAKIISEVIEHPDDKYILSRKRQEVLELCSRFPIYEFIDGDQYSPIPGV